VVVVAVVVVVQVVHAAVRIVRSNPITTATQVSSRVFIVWGILWLVPEVCTNCSTVIDVVWKFLTNFLK